MAAAEEIEKFQTQLEQAQTEHELKMTEMLEICQDKDDEIEKLRNQISDMMAAHSSTEDVEASKSQTQT